MNRFFKIMLVLSSIIAIVGIILIGIGAVTGARLGLGVRGTGIEIASNEKIKDSKPTVEEFSKINVDLGYADVIIEEGTDYGIDMLYYDSKYIPEYSIKNGELYITDNSKEEGAYNFINLDLSLGFEKNVITIYVPAGTVIAGANVTVDCGSITLNDVAVSNIITSNGLGRTVLNLFGKEKDYSFDLDTTVGTVSIDKRIIGIDYVYVNEGSTYKLESKNSCGNIKINFKK